MQLFEGPSSTDSARLRMKRMHRLIMLKSTGINLENQLKNSGTHNNTERQAECRKLQRLLA